MVIFENYFISIKCWLKLYSNFKECDEIGDKRVKMLVFSQVIVKRNFKALVLGRSRVVFYSWDVVILFVGVWREFEFSDFNGG